MWQGCCWPRAQTPSFAMASIRERACTMLLNLAGQAAALFSYLTPPTLAAPISCFGMWRHAQEMGRPESRLLNQLLLTSWEHRLVLLIDISRWWSSVQLPNF